MKVQLMPSRTLKTIGIYDETELACQDIMAVPEQLQEYDSIVVSEVLEHMENPLAALSLKKLLRPGGYIYVNMPANSPCPDHLFLIREPEKRPV